MRSRPAPSLPRRSERKAATGNPAGIARSTSRTTSSGSGFRTVPGISARATAAFGGADARRVGSPFPPGNLLSIEGGGQDRIARRRRVLVERPSVQGPDGPDDALLEKRSSADVGRCRDERAGPFAPDMIVHRPIRGPGAHFRWDRGRRPDDYLASVRGLCNRLAVEQVCRSRFTTEGSHGRLRCHAPHQPDNRVTAGNELAHDPAAEDAAGPGHEHAHTAVMSIERLNIAGLIVP